MGKKFIPISLKKKTDSFLFVLLYHVQFYINLLLAIYNSLRSICYFIDVVSASETTGGHWNMHDTYLFPTRKEWASTIQFPTDKKKTTHSFIPQRTQMFVFWKITKFQWLICFCFALIYFRSIREVTVLWLNVWLSATSYKYNYNIIIIKKLLLIP